MIKKVIKIKDVVRFSNYTASGVGDTQLMQTNIIYAENGKGKTTLVAILKSLGLNDPEWILRRKTFGMPAGKQNLSLPPSENSESLVSSYALRKNGIIEAAMVKKSSLFWVAQEKTPAKTYITRVFNFGMWEEWQAMKRDFSPRQIRDAVLHPLRGQWTRRGKAFAETLFGCHLPDDALISLDV